MSGQITASLDAFRDLRDAWCERLFKSIYESPWIAAMVGFPERPANEKDQDPTDWLRSELKRLAAIENESYIEQGTPFDGGVRMLLYQGLDAKVADERQFRLIQQFMSEIPEDSRPTLAQVKQAFRRQFLILLLDEERAINALPKLLPDTDRRELALEIVYRIATARGDLNDAQKERFRRIEEILGVTSQENASLSPKETTRPQKARREPDAMA